MADCRRYADMQRTGEYQYYTNVAAVTQILPPSWLQFESVINARQVNSEHNGDKQRNMSDGESGHLVEDSGTRVTQVHLAISASLKHVQVGIAQI